MRNVLDYIGRFLLFLVVVVVVDESLGVCVLIVESVAGVLDMVSGVVVEGSAVVGALVLGDEVIGPVDGDIGPVEGDVGAPGEAGVVCASAADESVMAAMAVRVAIRIWVGPFK